MRARILSFFIFFAVLLLLPARVSAAVTDAAPNQEACDNGSTTYTWDGEGLDRPVIASMSVDGETIADPTNPSDGSIGVAICPNVEDARKTGIFVIYRDGMNYHMDLTDAETPLGNPITADSEITITLTDMGELAEFYSFSLVHGDVKNWETDNLGTSSASLTTTISPARNPFVDFEEEGAQFCTATPPVCDVEQSRMDVLSVSIDMDYDQQETFVDMQGSYFGLISATGGYVTNEEGSLVATLGAPHFLEDGVTENVGSMQAFLPNSVVESILRLEPRSIDTSSLVISRSEEGEVVRDDVTFEIEEVAGGIILTVEDITFSSPAYTIAAATAGESGSGGGGGSLADTGNNQLALVLLSVGIVSAGAFLRFGNSPH